MRIYSKAVSKWSEATRRYELVERESVWREYSGSLALAKGGASKAEMQSADQQKALEDQLAQQQLGLQQQQLGLIDPVIQRIIANGGLLPEQQAALTAANQNLIGQNYAQNVGAINQALLTRGVSGGQNAGGGATAGLYGGMLAALAGQQQQGVFQIQQAKQAGLQGALNTALGVGGQYGQNVGAFNSGANQALGAGVTAAGNYDQAQSSVLGPLLGAVGGLGGSAITKWCVVASECYGGWDVPKVRFIRARLALRAMTDWRWTLFMTGYTLAGGRVAAMVRQSAWLKARITRLFDRFLVKEMDAVLNAAVEAYEL